MANGKGYFVYRETQTINGVDFYAFDVSLAHEDWMDVVFPITGLPDELLPLLVIDIPTEIPSIILEDTAIDDSFTAPDDLYYVFTESQTFIEAAKPTAPLEASVIIGNALMESAICWYADRTPNGDMEIPGDNDPSDYVPDVNGWYLPAYSDWDFKTKVVSQRSTGFQTASLDWLFSWVYDGCTDMDEDYHVMETLDEATFNFNAIYTWTAAQYINCCNVGTGSYLIESGGSGGSTYIQVWIFSPETDKTRHYSEGLLTPVVKNPGTLPIIAALVFILMLFSMGGGQVARLPKLGPPILYRPRGHWGQYPRGHWGQYPRGHTEL